MYLTTSLPYELTLTWAVHDSTVHLVTRQNKLETLRSKSC